MANVRGIGTFLLQELVTIIGLISLVSFSDVNESLNVSVNVKAAEVQFWCEIPHKPPTEASVHCLGMFISMSLSFCLSMRQGSECQCFHAEARMVQWWIMLLWTQNQESWCGMHVEWLQKQSWSFVRSMAGSSKPLLSRIQEHRRSRCWALIRMSSTYY